MGLKILHCKKVICCKMFQSASRPGFILWYDLKRTRFCTWNIRSLFWVGAIKSVVGELEKYKLDLVGVQEVRWKGEGYQTVDNYTFFYGKGC
jgi:hypothetical protein